MKCGVPLSDFATGLYAAFHIAAALYERQSTGKGVHIDASMLGSSLGIAPLQVSEYFGTGKKIRNDWGRAILEMPLIRRSKHRMAILSWQLAINDCFEIVCNVVERPDLAGDTRFTSTARRAKNQRELAQILEQEFAANSADYWYQRFRDAGVPTAPINHYGDVLGDVQVEDQGWVQQLELPGGTVTKTFAHPILHTGRDLPIRRPPPDINEHEKEIRSEIESASVKTEVISQSPSILDCLYCSPPDNTCFGQLETIDAGRCHVAH